MNKKIIITIIMILILIATGLFSNLKKAEDVSIVAINRSYKNNSLEITITGNTDLNLTLKKDRITGFVALPVDEKLSLKDGHYEIKVEQK